MHEPARSGSVWQRCSSLQEAASGYLSWKEAKFALERCGHCFFENIVCKHWFVLAFASRFRCPQYRDLSVVVRRLLDPLSCDL